MSKTELYHRMVTDISALLADERDPVANAANVAAVLYHELPNVNWAGFYFLRGDELVLGPFQGKSACVRIPFGKGVCGIAAKSRLAVLVPDVHEFPGHIACDAASRSEIVVPLLRDGKLVGVLDLDSPEMGRFDDEDRRGLEAVASVFCQLSDPPAQE